MLMLPKIWQTLRQFISSKLASQEADLQMRNETEARAQEFDYGMQSMGAQFDYQNQFANAQYDRDIGMLNATVFRTVKTYKRRDKSG